MYSGPQRKPLRLESFDYNSEGYYFVTICTKGRLAHFGNVENGEMIQRDYGNILDHCLKNIHVHFPYSQINEYIVMPNHFHAIIIIEDPPTHVGNADLRSLRDETMFQDRTKMMLSKIIHGIKSSCTREIRKDYGDYEFSWQKSFYDVIIRNEEQLQKTRQYILDNPKNWESDVNYIRNGTLSL